MAIVPMSKIQLFILRSKKAEIFEFLQDQGVLQLEEMDGPRLQIPEKYLETEARLADSSYAIQFLSAYQKEKNPFKYLFLGNVEVTNIEKVKKTALQYDFSTVVKQIKDIELNITHSKNEIIEINQEIDILRTLEKYDCPLENLANLEKTSVLVGNTPVRDFLAVREELEAMTSNIFIEVLKETTEKTYFFVVSLADQRKDIQEILTKFHFIETEFSEKYKLSAKKEIERLQIQKTELLNRQKNAEEEAVKMCRELPKLKMLHDYCLWEKERKEALAFATVTESVVFFTGWMPQKKISFLQKKMEEISPEVALFEIPKEKDEIPPVELENNVLTTPFQAVTKLYGLPSFRDFDPTPLLASFFLLFFGLCLTDVGYGAILFLTMIIFLKFTIVPRGIKPLFQLLLIGGLSTIAMGIIFGSWFGIEMDMLPQWIQNLQVFDSVSDPLTVLAIMLGLGVFQILFGITLKFIHTIKHSGFQTALMDQGLWLWTLIMLGLFGAANFVPMLESSLLLFKYCVWGGLLGLVLTQGRHQKTWGGKLGAGVLSLYNIVGYFSDVLSFSRLLALGLATGVIAGAVNLIAGIVIEDKIQIGTSGIALADGVSVFSFIGSLFFMILILVIGHIFNLLINALGSFIHSARLQFIEFFTKFLEGGGRSFMPLQRKEQMVYLEDR